MYFKKKITKPISIHHGVKINIIAALLKDICIFNNIIPLIETLGTNYFRFI